MGDLIAIYQAYGNLAKVSIVILCVVLALAATLAAWEHGWLRAPHPIGSPIRAIGIMAIFSALSALVGYSVWPKGVIVPTKNPIPNSAVVLRDATVKCDASKRALQVYLGIWNTSPEKLSAKTTLIALWNGQPIANPDPKAKDVVTFDLPGITHDTQLGYVYTLEGETEFNSDNWKLFKKGTGYLTYHLVVVYPADRWPRTQYNLTTLIRKDCTSADVSSMNWDDVTQP